MLAEEPSPVFGLSMHRDSPSDLPPFVGLDGLPAVGPALMPAKRFGVKSDSMCFNEIKTYYITRGIP